MLWLWCRLAAVPLIRPLAREPPDASDMALERPKKKRKKERQKRNPAGVKVPRQWKLKVERWKDLVGCRVIYRISAPVTGIVNHVAQSEPNANGFEV